MFTCKENGYQMSIEEIARKINKEAHVSIGVTNVDPVVGHDLMCAKYCFLERGNHDWDIAIAPRSGTEVKSVEKIAEGLYLVWAMKPTCVDEVGPYPYLVATRVYDYNYKIAPAIPNHLCNVAFTTERPEVGKGCNLMVVHFHRIYRDYQLMTPIQVNSIKEVVMLGDDTAWVRTDGENEFSMDFFVKFPSVKNR